MDWNNIITLAQKELRDARHNRWLILYAIAFGLLALALAWMALSGAGAYGTVGFGRTAASLINLVLLVVPLMGLTLGALSMASERENGTLLYLLSQPISRIEVVLGKYLGLALALLGALTLGFGISGVFIALRGGTPQVGDYIALVALAYFLSLVSLSFGFLLSVLAKKGATAVGLALFLWLLLAFFTDLGLMGTALALKMQVREVFLLSLVNPLQVFKMSAILVLRGSLDVLGPGGTYAVRTYGDGLLPVLLSILAFLTILPLAASYLIFQKRGDV